MMPTRILWQILEVRATEPGPSGDAARKSRHHELRLSSSTRAFAGHGCAVTVNSPLAVSADTWEVSMVPEQGR